MVCRNICGFVGDSYVNVIIVVLTIEIFYFFPTERAAYC